MTRMMRPLSASMAAVIVALLLLAATTLASPPPRAHAQTGCSSAIDLMVVLDGSESISWSEFDTMQGFVSDLISRFTVSPADAHVGIVQFAGEGQGRVEWALSGDAGAIQTAIFDMTQIIGVTDIQEGIALGQEQLTLNGRAGVPHVLLLLTDGEHNQPGDPIAEAELARSLGTEIFAVGIGAGPKLDELHAIVTALASEHAFSVDNFNELVTILEPLVEIACPPTPTPTATATATTMPPTGTPPAPIESPMPGATPGPTTSPTSEVIGVTRLPPVGSNTLAPNREGGDSRLQEQALVGAASAILFLAVTYWFARRPEQP